MDITAISYEEHRKNLDSGKYSAIELTLAYLEKAEKSDLNAFITIDRDGALSAAEEADRRLSLGERGGVLGIPVAVKDNIVTKGLRTTCASRMLENYIPPYDATAIEKLRGLGAVIIGKTNLDEFAMGCTTETSYFGRTLNPYDKNLTPGGSSGGSCAAVAAGLVPVALGSDTGGSIRQPAAFCGVFAINPTYGKVSRSGLVAFASSLDRIGVAASSAMGAKAFLSAISGKDPLDATSRDVPDIGDFTLKGLRIGIADEFFEGCAEAIADETLKVLRLLESLGAKAVKISFPSLKYALSAYHIISSAEASSNLARFDGIRYGHRTSDAASGIEDMITKNRSEGFGEEVKRRIVIGTHVLSVSDKDKYLKKAYAARDMIKADYDKAFDKCDIILSPTVVSAPYEKGLFEKSPVSVYYGDRLLVPSSLSGLPSVAVPVEGANGDIPTSVLLTARAGADLPLLSLAELIGGAE